MIEVHVLGYLISVSFFLCFSNPDKLSYREEALAVHHQENHHNSPPSLKFKLSYTVRNTIMRKIHEAFVINNLKPQINDKDECIFVKKFLVSYI